MRICTQLSLVALVLAALLQFTVVRSADTGAAHNLGQLAATHNAELGGQTEASRSLGLTAWSTMKLVVLPQAIKNVLPALANEIITMVKESSICSMLGMVELMFAAKTVASTTYISLGPYVVAAVIYFCINYPASKGIEAIERRMRRGDKQ